MPWLSRRSVGALPEALEPAQVRGALTAVIGRTLGAPGTFDADGWLRIGLAGHQPDIGERYISTGSLYLASLVLLPLGRPADRPLLDGPARALDLAARLVWRGLPHRPRPRGAGPVAPATSRGGSG